MIITFCGHSDFFPTEEIEKRLLLLLEEKVREEPIYMYLGGYGGFDKFAYNCCKKYQRSNFNVKVIYITPYVTVEYQKNHLADLKLKYDEIIYPEIEDKPLRFAISYRNKWMVEKADLVIAYVSHNWGGAYQTYKYAKRKGKEVINLAE